MSYFVHLDTSHVIYSYYCIFHTLSPLQCLPVVCPFSSCQVLQNLNELYYCYYYYYYYRLVHPVISSVMSSELS